MHRHPLACRKPVDDMTRVPFKGETLNARTLAMLETAQTIYGGPGDLLRVVQGSYTDAVAGSFGTHAGGGAVDISIRDPRQPASRLFDEVEAMVRALRLAGFAAWYRGPDSVFAGSVPHIHAIAIGDPGLSAAARRQVDGREGYMRGFDGLPTTEGDGAPSPGGAAPPGIDAHGGPVVCGWMGVGGRASGLARRVRPE
ncbi:MAG: hypothetical protein IT332_02220 [Ardenticatenales bacterium]|nr:hypothetical protein [Ardenticatenales bacterium]